MEYVSLEAVKGDTVSIFFFFFLIMKKKKKQMSLACKGRCKFVECKFVCFLMLMYTLKLSVKLKT